MENPLGGGWWQDWRGGDEKVAWTAAFSTV